MNRPLFALLSLPLLMASANVQPPAASSNVIVRSSTTITGQPLALPPGAEVVISVTELPAGGVLPMHRHPWPRYAYVERGQLSVRYVDAGLERVFGPGEAVVEAIDQWHEGRVVGSDPIRIVVIDHVPPGQTNVVRR